MSAFAEQLARLREQADACRGRAIALDAKLRMYEPACRQLHPLREQLHAGSARLDRAINDLEVAMGVAPSHRTCARARAR